MAISPHSKRIFSIVVDLSAAGWCRTHRCLDFRSVPFRVSSVFHYLDYLYAQNKMDVLDLKI